MATLEDELRDLKEKNNELAQKVQHWKMLAGQRENEKLDLMKEINELRLKLSRLRSNGSVQASNFDAALQSAAQKALAHLVRASNEIATTIKLSKGYMRDREEIDNASPRWSSIGGTPSTAKKDRIHRVPPLMIGGQSIQPVVALTMLDTSNATSAARSSNQNRNVTERVSMPVHMLQDVYIPLTRIDVDLHMQNMEPEEATEANDSGTLLQLDNDEDKVDESQKMDEDEEFESTRVLDSVKEDTEPDTDEETPPSIRSRMTTNRIDNPLEGPSWMLDAVSNDQARGSCGNLEPDSTTEGTPRRRAGRGSPPPDHTGVPLVSVEFTPTVRRRKRASSPPAPLYSPRRAPPRRLSNSGRVLKVLVAKMRLEADGEGTAAAAASPAKRAATAAALAAAHAPATAAAAHAPSPNGATDTRVIVSETSQDELESLPSSDTPTHQHRAEDDWPSDDEVEQPTNTREKNEITTKENERNAKERNKQPEDSPEEPWINTNRRTHSRDRTVSRERNKQSSRDHDVEMEVERNDTASRENRERNVSKHELNWSNRERNERTNSRERRQTNREGVERQTDSRAGSEERSESRHKQSRSRDRSNEGREEVRSDSRASDDSGRYDDNRAGGRAASCESDSSGASREREGRSRRARKLVVYKEKPLNRKMRR